MSAPPPDSATGCEAVELEDGRIAFVFSNAKVAMHVLAEWTVSDPGAVDEFFNTERFKESSPWDDFTSIPGGADYMDAIYNPSTEKPPSTGYVFRAITDDLAKIFINK